MKLYNSLTKKVEEFVPNVEGKVGMYTCGPTVYHYAHIGNLRSYIMEDVLEKELRFEGYDVKRVMNITDVGHLTSDGDSGEDKMLKGARREHKSVMQIAAYYTDCFFSDCEKLNIRNKPNMNGEIICVVAKGSIVVIYETESTDEWYKVCAENGAEGFCMRKFIEVTSL